MFRGLVRRNAQRSRLRERDCSEKEHRDNSSHKRPSILHATAAYCSYGSIEAVKKRITLEASRAAALKRTTTTGSAPEYWIFGVPVMLDWTVCTGKSALVVEIDADVRKEYWTEIRKQPEHDRKSPYVVGEISALTLITPAKGF